MESFLPRQRKSHTLEEDELTYSPSPSPAENSKMTGAPPAKKPKATPNAKISKKQAEVGTCSLSKKEFGDEIKAALRLEKYEVHRMRINA